MEDKQDNCLFLLIISIAKIMCLVSISANFHAIALIYSIFYHVAVGLFAFLGKGTADISLSWVLQHEIFQL